jgi:hypothetical protein
MAQFSTREPPPPARQERLKVVYVMGAGRSGSTILGVTLGNCANVFYAGELDAWLVRSGVPQLDGAQRARFWSAVREEVSAADELFGSEAQRSLERSLALFRIHKWPTRRRIRQRYRRIAEDLYHTIGRASNVTHVVDTSHYPLRARELQQLGGIDLYLVYLVRNPQSVVASFRRKDVAQYSKSLLTTNLYLWLTHLLSVFVFLRHPPDRRMVVHYENLIASPREMLGDVLAHIDSLAAVPDLSRLESGIPFQGNRVIRSEAVTLDSRAALVAHPSRVTALLQLPWELVLARLRPVAQPSSLHEA